MRSLEHALKRMRTHKGKITFLLTFCTSVIILSSACVMLSAPLVTQWYLWKLRTGKLEERKMAAAKLGGIGCRAVPLILNAIKRDLWDERRKMLDLSDPNEAYLWPFAIIGKSAILPLIRALNDPDLARSMAAMAVL